MTSVMSLRPLDELNLTYHPLSLITHELNLTAFSAHRAAVLKVPLNIFSTFLNGEKETWEQPLKCPHGKLRLTVKQTINPGKRTDKMPIVTIIKNGLWKASGKQEVMIRTSQGTFVLAKRGHRVMNGGSWSNVFSAMKIMQSNCEVNANEDLLKLEDVKMQVDLEEDKPLIKNRSPDKRGHDDHRFLHGLGQTDKVGNKKSAITYFNKVAVVDEKLNSKLKETKKLLAKRIQENNQFRCHSSPIYGLDLVQTLTFENSHNLSSIQCVDRDKANTTVSMFDLHHIVHTQDNIVERLRPFTKHFLFFVPPCLSVSRSAYNDMGALSSKIHFDYPGDGNSNVINFMDSLVTSFKLQLPETRLIQYDCGKLQALHKLLRNLKYDGHRVLIFTQMTKVLDILEAFLSFHGFTYLRLDGSTKIDQRHISIERFNNNKKYFCFILSTRSGGVGVNLTGADTVIFYDSDWNPTMDAQAQDRCHRIGQTRDVHIYRLVSYRTIEENILKKANQKRLLGDLAIEGGNFTTAFFKQQTIQELFKVDSDNKNDGLDGDADQDVREIRESDAVSLAEGVSKKAIGTFETAITTVEEVQDITVNS